MESTQILSRIIELSNNTREDYRERLRRILQFLADCFQADQCLLYVYVPDEGILSLSLTSNGDPQIEETIRMGEGIVGEAAMLDEPVFSRGGPMGDSPELGSSPLENLAAYPIRDCSGLAGVLLVRKGGEAPISELERSVMETAALQIAGTIVNANLYLEGKKKVDKLTALFEISKAVNSTIELEKLLDLIVATSVQVLGAEGGVLRLIDPKTNMLTVTSRYGKIHYPHRHLRVDTLGEDSCRAVRTGAPMHIMDSLNEFVCREEIKEKVKSYICVPLCFKEKLLGVLSVFNKTQSRLKGDRFDREDVELLATMAGYIANAIEHAMTFREVENLVHEKDRALKESSILYGTSTALMKAVDLERVLRTVLTTVTIGNGLGFNRAMLFLLDKKANKLKGRMAVGPDSAEEAGKIWDALSKDRKSLLEWLSSEEMAKSPRSRINETIKGVEFSLGERNSPLVRCVRQRRSFIVRKKGTCHDLERRLKGIEIPDAFAVVPIMSKTETLGALMVDNLYNRKKITAKDIRFLSMFASQVGTAIENSILYENLKEAHEELRRMNERLVHSEKLAALGEFATRMAHEIRNPLVSIGGYARRLQKRWRKDYVGIIIKEVDRLEALLTEILSFSQAGREDFSEEDLNDMIQEALKELEAELTEHRIKTELELTGELPSIFCDRRQIKEVFLNLVKNAIDAMKDGGTLTVRSLISYEPEQTYLIAQLSDNGPGIPIDILHNIFNPFFTTKDSGTGLGLALVHTMVANHNGHIEVRNNPGAGSTFTIKLPLKK